MAFVSSRATYRVAFIASLVWISSVLAQECEPDAIVYLRGAQCESAGDLQIDCPAETEIEVIMAGASRLLDGDCQTDEAALGISCLLEQMTYYVNWLCRGQSPRSTCVVPVDLWQNLTTANCDLLHAGENILHYTYICIAVPVPELSLCDEVAIASNSVDLTGPSVANDGCGCTLIKSRYTELLVRRATFTGDSCDQRVVIRDAKTHESARMCPAANVTFLWPCESDSQEDDDLSQELTIFFESDDADGAGNFMVNIDAPYDRPFLIRCGLLGVPSSSIEITTPHTTTTSTTTPTTTNTSTTTPTTTTTSTTTPTTTTTSTTTPTTTTTSTTSTTTPTTTTTSTTSTTTTTPTTTTTSTTTPTTTTTTTTTPTTTTTTPTTTTTTTSTTTTIKSTHMTTQSQQSTAGEQTNGLPRGTVTAVIAGVTAFIIILAGIIMAVSIGRKGKKDNPSADVYDEPNDIDP